MPKTKKKFFDSLVDKGIIPKESDFVDFVTRMKYEPNYVDSVYNNIQNLLKQGKLKTVSPIEKIKSVFETVEKTPFEPQGLAPIWQQLGVPVQTAPAIEQPAETPETPELSPLWTLNTEVPPPGQEEPVLQKQVIPLSAEPPIAPGAIAPSATSAEQTRLPINQTNEDDVVNVAFNAINRGVLQGQQANILTATRTPTEDELYSLAKINKELRDTQIAPAVKKFNEAKGFKDAFSAFVEHPLEITADLTLSSMSALATHGLARMGTGAATGAALGSVVPGIGTAAGVGSGVLAGMGVSSLNLEYSGSILGSLEEAGIDITDGKSLIDGFKNKDLMDKARTYALKRGVPIVIFDMVSGGLAGRFAAKAGSGVLKKIGAGALETGIQMGTGAGGETFAQVMTDEYNPSAILAEALGELGPGAGEIAVGTIIHKAKQGQIDNNSINKLVANNPEMTPEKFRQALDVAVGSGEIHPKDGKNLLVLVEEAHKINATIPSSIITDADKRSEAIGIIWDRNDAQNELMNADEAFKPEIQFKIDGYNEQLKGLMKKPELQPKQPVIDLSTGEPVPGTEQTKKAPGTPTEAASTEPAVSEANKPQGSRHAETSEDAKGIVSGHSDTPLSAKGKEQAQAMAETPEFKNAEVIHTSEIPRAEQTGDEIAAITGAQVIMNPKLNTLDVGEHTGKTKETEFDERKYFDKPDEVIPGGESPQSFIDRMEKAFPFVKSLPENETFIAHSKVMKALNALKAVGGKWNETAKEIYLDSGTPKDKLWTDEEAKAKAEEFKSKTSEANKNPALKDVESTANALEGVDEIIADKNLSKENKIIKITEKAAIGIDNLDNAKKLKLAELSGDKANAIKKNKIAVEYAKAKANGSNPELVKAVEELLGKAKPLPMEAESKGITVPEPIATEAAADVFMREKPTPTEAKPTTPTEPAETQMTAQDILDAKIKEGKTEAKALKELVSDNNILEDIIKELNSRNPNKYRKVC